MFISYRREDASGFAGRLHEALSRHLGDERVFRDIDKIRPGATFGQVIHESLESCGAFVVVIGREWLVDGRGRRRLDDPDDWVRQEITLALGRSDVTIFPVLVEDVSMPLAADLPEPLVALAGQNAIELSDTRWTYDVSRLIGALDAVVGAPDQGRLRRWAVPTTVLGGVVRAALVAAVVAVLALTGVVPIGSSSGPDPMTGEYNVAVADFASAATPGRSSPVDDARDLSQSVYDRLDEELAAIPQSGLRLELRPPGETGPVRGTTPDQRADSAATLAREINADIVVYGTLGAEVPSQVTIEFFLADRRLEDAVELVGQHELGSPARAVGDIRNPVARQDLTDQVLARTRALAEFIVGLSYYSVNDNQLALDHFETASSSPGWDDRAGKQVLYLFLGNASGKLHQFVEADAFYDRAISLDPQYARARLGKAEVAFQQARSDCEKGNADPAGLSKALDLYQVALGSPAQPAPADIPTKVAFGSGRILLCLSQALVADRWADAERELKNVIRVFRDGNERVREMAAESYADLGLVYLPTATDPDADRAYRRAAEAFRSALGVTQRDERKALYLSLRGFALSRLGDAAGAQEAYAQAVALERDPAKKAEYERARVEAAPDR